MKIKDVIIQESSDVISEGDAFDIELGDIVIETGVVGFTEDGVIVEADEKTLALLGISGALFESVDINEVSLGDYYTKATKNKALSQMGAAFAPSPEERAKNYSIAGRRERGLARAKTRTDKIAATAAAKQDADYKQSIRDKYAGVDLDAEIAKLKPAIERAYHDYQYGARNTYSAARDEYQRLQAKVQELERAKKILQGVAEAGMPASVIKSKQRYSQMTPAEFAKAHGNKSDDELKAMAWRHGYGKGSNHYVDKRNKGQQGVAEAFIAPGLSAANAAAEFRRHGQAGGGYKGRIDIPVGSEEDYLEAGRALKRAAKQKGQHIEYGLSGRTMSVFSDSMNSDELDAFIDDVVVSGLGESVVETRVGNRMSDMSVGSPKIVHKNGRAVGEIGLDHDPSPGQGPYYMKHYETNTWYSGYATKKEALLDLKHVVDQMNEAKYQGREVPLGKPMAGDVKKSKVYVRGPKGNVVKVNFGDKKMKIKKSNPKRRKSFRARHNCANPGPRWKARYWSCRAW